MVECPICSKPVKSACINQHIDSQCQSFIETDSLQPAPQDSVSSFFQRPTMDRGSVIRATSPSKKRSNEGIFTSEVPDDNTTYAINEPPLAKKSMISRPFQKEAPLATRMRPRTFNEICGQELVSPKGALRNLIEQGRVPSMVLWGHPGTGKTTIARVIASMTNSRFVEINSTNTGVGECKRLFSEARNEHKLTRRKTIMFCDEVHRFSKSQQEIFLEPVESGQIILIGATIENPSFKLQSTLLSRCRVFSLQKLTTSDIQSLLNRALDVECPSDSRSCIFDSEMLAHLSASAEGDARTALGLLEIAISLSMRKDITIEEVKKSMTQTLVFNPARAGRYDTMSAFHESIRVSQPDAALFYLARMLEFGEDPLYISRHLILIASDDIGVADNTLLPLATAAHSAVEKVGMPECRISLAHATVALARAKKSMSVFRGLAHALAAHREPGVSDLAVPVHLRNTSIDLMKGSGYEKTTNNTNDRDGINIEVVIH